MRCDMRDEIRLSSAFRPASRNDATRIRPDGDCEAGDVEAGDVELGCRLGLFSRGLDNNRAGQEDGGAEGRV